MNTRHTENAAPRHQVIIRERVLSSVRSFKGRESQLRALILRLLSLIQVSWHRLSRGKIPLNITMPKVTDVTARFVIFGQPPAMKRLAGKSIPWQRLPRRTTHHD